MSENLTHTGSLDDCLRLMLGSETFGEAFRLVGREQRDAARLGAITRYGDLFTVSLLTDFRDRWEARKPGDNLEPKLAFTLGWLCHRAADRQMKPVFRELEPGRPVSPAHTSVYNDALVFHEIYNSGRGEPYHPAMWEESLSSLSAAGALDVAALEELFRVFTQRALLELHTLNPDRGDIEGWLDRLFALRQTYYVDRARYAAAVLNPDPEMMRKYITEANFYDPKEPIIAAARAIQRGEGVTPEAVRAAVAAGAASHYGKILEMGFGYLQAANDFFTRSISADDLSERLNIGKPGRDGAAV